jgi:hypothetical protein
MEGESEESNQICVPYPEGFYTKNDTKCICPPFFTAPPSRTIAVPPRSRTPSDMGDRIRNFAIAPFQSLPKFESIDPDFYGKNWI